MPECSNNNTCNDWYMCRTYIAKEKCPYHDKATETPTPVSTTKFADYAIYLPVNKETGETDYMYIEYCLRSEEEVAQPEHELIDGWEFKKFNIVKA